MRVKLTEYKLGLNNPTIRVFLNPKIVMHIICYIKKQWESGRVGLNSGRVRDLVAFCATFVAD